jgi:uncharacterized membrane protein YdjX (TVP38/TMEM64 family)
MTPNAITDARAAGSSGGPALADGSSHRRAKLPRLIVGLALAAGATWAVAHRSALDAAALEGLLAGLGPWAPLAFIALYAASTVLLVPGSVLTLAGGALFGPILGAVYSLAGATLGATLSFLISRYLAADLVARRTGERLRVLLDGVARLDWRFVAFVRLVPLLPFNALNYALGLTSIRLLPYVVASAVCMAPGAAVYAYLGHAGREVASGREGSFRAALVALSLLGALSLVPSLVRRLPARP